MNTIPMVSILVITYNQEAYIGKALDSLLMQECPFDYEILVGEDCSTDGTRNICLEYTRNNPDKIRLFLNEKNKGLTNNYFDLLEQANGKYLADCGGDDYWLTEDRLKRQVELLEQHPDVSLVYGNWQVFRQKDHFLETNKSGRSEDWFEPEYYGIKAVRNYLNERDFPRVVLSASCFRTNWIKEIIKNNQDLFRGEKVVCEDLPITLGLLMKGPFYMMKEELMVYRVLEQSVTHNEYLKGFSYHAFIQTLVLALSLGVQFREIAPYIKKHLPNFIFYAFMIGDKVWMNGIINDVKGYGISLSVKQKIMYICTQNRWIHRIVFKSYRIFKGGDVCTK